MVTTTTTTINNQQNENNYYLLNGRKKNTIFSHALPRICRRETLKKKETTSAT